MRMKYTLLLVAMCLRNGFYVVVEQKPFTMETRRREAKSASMYVTAC